MTKNALQWVFLILMVASAGSVRYKDTADSMNQIKFNEKDTSVLNQIYDKEGNGENPPAPPPSTDPNCGCEVYIEGGGPVRGHALYSGLAICAYINIPYGKIEHPFQAPSKPEPWTDIHEVKEHSKKCPQILDSNMIGDLDCLVLNIFKPEVIENAPVLFHIHGGNFQEGSADPFLYGPENLVSKDIILVLPNYRVGPLGFLCLKNSIAPGNAALKDLTLALQWVETNIRKFGGDPNKVTVSGDGWAGALVSLLAVSAQSRNLFNKAITESGSVLSPWAIDRDSIIKGMELAKLLSKAKNESKEGSDVFENVELATLLNVSLAFLFMPCIEENEEGAFLHQTPWSILKSKQVNISFLIGSADQSGMHEALQHTLESIDHLNNNHINLLPLDLVFEQTSEKTEAANDIKTLYFKDQNITEEHRNELARYYTDIMYLGPGLRMARLLVNAGAKIFLYEFSYVGSLNRERNGLRTPLPGATRGDLAGYLFAQEGKVDEQDEKMVQLITELWSNFINTGEPRTCSITWRPLAVGSVDDEAWLSLGHQVLSQHGLHTDRLELWTRLYEEHYADNEAINVLIPSYIIGGVLVLPHILDFI